MMRALWFVLLVPFLTAATADPVEIFGACAYTPILPTRSAVGKPPVEIRIETGAGAPDVLEQLKGDPRFNLSVTSQFSAYLYLFQDPPDPTTLIFPDLGKDDNKLKKGVTWSNRFKLTSAQRTTMLIAVSPIPLPDVAKLSANDVRQYFQARARCGTFFLQEKQF